MPRKPTSARRQQPDHAVEHAEAGAQDRHDERLGAGQLDAASSARPGSRCRTARRGPRGWPRRPAASPARRRAAGTWGSRCACRAGSRQLVGDERVVGDVDAHRRNLARDDQDAGPAVDPRYAAWMGQAARPGRRGAAAGRRAGRRARASARTATSRRGAQRARGARRTRPRTPRSSRSARRPPALGSLAARGLHPGRHARAVRDVRRGAGAGPRRPVCVFGAWDPKAGACGSVWDLVRDRRATHRVEVVGGVREQECAALLPASSPAAAPISSQPVGSGSLSGGGVSERPKEHASKACVGVTPPWVQIPPPPPHRNPPGALRPGVSCWRVARGAGRSNHVGRRFPRPGSDPRCQARVWPAARGSRPSCRSRRGAGRSARRCCGASRGRGRSSRRWPG